MTFTAFAESSKFFYECLSLVSLTTGMDGNEIAVKLPKDLIAEWKFLVEMRQAVEG